MTTINITDAIKSIQALASKLADGDQTAEQLAEIAAQCTTCLSQIRMSRTAANAQNFDPSGYSQADTFWCHSFYCDVLRKTGGGGNEYLLMADIGTGSKQPVAHFSSVPGAEDISQALQQAGLITEPLPLGYEYAINVNTTNAFPSNFMSEAMRDCAIDDLIHKLGPDEDITITTFEIHPDGTQCAKEAWSIEDWLEARGLGEHDADPAPSQRDRKSVV